MVTRPKPKPRWGYSPPGYVRRELPLAAGHLKTLLDILELSSDHEDRLRLIIIKLSHSIAIFEYTLEFGEALAGSRANGA